MAGMAAGAVEAAVAAAAVLDSNPFDISRIELSPSVDVHLVQQSPQRAVEELKSDSAASSQLETELDLPALSPQPHIGSVLEAVEQQSSGDRGMSGRSPELPCSPNRSPSADVQHSHYSAIPNSSHHFHSQLRQFTQQQQLGATQMSPHARHSTYTYNPPHQQPHQHPSPPHIEYQTRYPPQHSYTAMPVLYPPQQPQPQPSVYSVGHHPSMAYYHGTVEASPPAHGQPSASDISAAHSYLHRQQVLEAQLNEVVRSYRQAVATQHTRSQQEHQLLVQHHEHHYQQLQMEMDSTKWMLHGNSLLTTAADRPSIHHYAHAAQHAHQQYEQAAEEEGEEEDDDESSEGAVAEVEALLAQTYEGANGEHGRKRKQSTSSDRGHMEGGQQEESKTGEKVAKKRKSKKSKRDPNAPAHPISAYIVSRTHS